MPMRFLWCVSINPITSLTFVIRNYSGMDFLGMGKRGTGWLNRVHSSDSSC